MEFGTETHDCFLTSGLGTYLSTLVMNTPTHTHSPLHKYTHTHTYTLTQGLNLHLLLLLLYYVGFQLSKGRQESSAFLAHIYPHPPSPTLAVNTGLALSPTISILPCHKPFPLRSSVNKFLIKAHSTDGKTLIIVMTSHGERGLSSADHKGLFAHTN